MTHPNPASAVLIAKELETFLRRDRLGSIYFAGQSKHPPQLAFLVRFPRVSLTLEGKDVMRVEVGGRTRELSVDSGDALFIPANCWNEPLWKHPARVLHLLFGKRHLGASLVSHSGSGSEPALARKASVHREIGGAMQGILSALAGAPGSTEVRQLLVRALLHCTHELLDAPPPAASCKARASFERACLYIQENSHRQLSRDSVAAALSLNPNHLSRLFREEGSMSFIDYLTWVRIDRAKYLLKQGDHCLDAVAAACGFAETAYFCRVFKKRTKLTPSEYRGQGLRESYR